MYFQNYLKSSSPDKDQILFLTFTVMDKCHCKYLPHFGNDDSFEQNLLVGFIDQARLSDAVPHETQDLVGPFEVSLGVLPHLLLSLFIWVVFHLFSFG